MTMLSSLKELCVSICVKHPLESLTNITTPKVSLVDCLNEPKLTPSSADAQTSTSDDDMVIQDMDGIDVCDCQVESTFDESGGLKGNIFLSHYICEQLFQGIAMEYSQKYLCIFTDSGKC